MSNPDSPEWRTLRERIIFRDGRKCFICGTRRDLTAHHIKPRDEGGQDEERNLIALCEKCHDYVEGENWAFILNMRHDKDEEKKFKYNKTLRMKYGQVIDMYRLINGELIKIGERYE